jgi:hypothetical protein
LSHGLALQASFTGFKMQPAGARGRRVAALEGVVQARLLSF